MKISIEFTESDPHHTRMSIFINGVNSGSLYMKTDEACSLHQIISLGCMGCDTFHSHGEIAEIDR